MILYHRVPRGSLLPVPARVPSPLVGEGQGGGDCRTSEVGIPPTPSPSPQGGGGSVGVRRYPQQHFRPFAAVVFFALVIAALPVHAVEPGEMLQNPALEARARHISQELRCLVCQNQSIDDSNAELARDLRLLVRERLAAGDSDAAVLAFVEARYGEFVLLRPRLSLHTALLWSAPLLLLAGATLLLVRRVRAARAGAGAAPQAAPLSPAEQQRLEALLGRGKE
jgi:cytochrome c-type biogenesis protein CcmH